MSRIEPLRVGIIGFGGAGMAHLHYFACIPGCRVMKVFDPKPAGRARAASYSGLEVCESLADFWPGLDAVSVCSPDRSHTEYIVEALTRSIHVICEKPLTDSVDGIRRILAAERDSKCVLAVLHQMRFVPLFKEMKKLVDTGRLGTVHLLEGYYVHDLRERAFAYDDWRERDAATPLVYAGCHFVDLLQWLSNDEMVAVQALDGHIAFPRYPQADTVLLSARFRSGSIGQVVVAFASAGPQDHSVRIYGTERTIDNNLLFRRPGIWEGMLHRPQVIQREVFRADRLEPRRVVQHLASNGPALLADRLFSMLRRLSPDGNAAYGARHYPLRLYEHGVACVDAIADFVDAIRRGGRPLCTASAAAQAVLACLAGNEAIAVGRLTAVPSLASI